MKQGHWGTRIGSQLAQQKGAPLNSSLQRLAAKIAAEEHAKLKEKRRLEAEEAAKPRVAAPHQKLSEDVVRAIRRDFEQKGKSRDYLMQHYGEPYKFSRNYLSALLSYSTRSKVLP